MRVYSLGTRSVAGDLAAVDVQDLAGNERRRLEDDDGVDDVADLAHVPYRGEPRAEPGVARAGPSRAWPAAHRVAQPQVGRGAASAAIGRGDGHELLI